MLSRPLSSERTVDDDGDRAAEVARAVGVVSKQADHRGRHFAGNDARITAADQSAAAGCGGPGETSRFLMEPTMDERTLSAIWSIGLDRATGLDVGGLPIAGTAPPRDHDEYWARRRNDRIYLMTLVFAHFFCRSKRTVADVGCHVSPLVLMVPGFSSRFAIDPSARAKEAWREVNGATFVNRTLEDVDVQALTGDDRFDLIICHQVIEHLEEPARFAALLGAKARRVILSTTFETPAGMIRGHVQDPIDLEKLESWLPSPPICTLVSRGPVGGKVLTVY